MTINHLFAAARNLVADSGHELVDEEGVAVGRDVAAGQKDLVVRLKSDLQGKD